MLAMVFLFHSCASSTYIQSQPSGAKLYINDEYHGETPQRYRDTKIVGSTNSVRLEKEGYQTLNTSFTRDEEADVGAIIGGIFVLIPFLWIMKYSPSRTYELKAEQAEEQESEKTTPSTTKKDAPLTEDKYDQLRKLNELKEEGILTEEEFANEKKKILNGGE
jgi:hypothetical protein